MSREKEINSETKEQRIERIRKSHAECRGDGKSDFICKCSSDSITFLLSTIDVLRAENAAMREAIEPFVELLDELEKKNQEKHRGPIVWQFDKIAITFIDLRKLSEAGRKG